MKTRNLQPLRRKGGSAAVPLLVIVLTLSACSNVPPAKYRGWSQSDDYFNDKGVSTRFGTSTEESTKGEPKTSKSSLGRCPNKYRVKAGDTLGKIALNCKVSLQHLAAENHLEAPYTIRIGQRLNIPSSAVGASSPETSAAKRENSLPSWIPKPQQGWQFPVTKPAKIQMQPKKVELSVEQPTPVFPVAEGKVVYAGNQLEAYGLMVVIKHPDNYLTAYAHLDALLIKRGAQAKKDQPIGLVVPKPETATPFYIEARYRGRKVPIEPLLPKPKWKVK